MFNGRPAKGLEWERETHIVFILCMSRARFDVDSVRVLGFRIRIKDHMRIACAKCFWNFIPACLLARNSIQLGARNLGLVGNELLVIK